MNYTVVIWLDAMTYMPSFIKIDSGRKVISYAYYYFFKIRKVG
jgi:hypothetical protein